MDRYEAVVRYIGTGDYVPRIEKYADGDLVLYAEAASRIADLEAQLAASEAKCADTYQDVLLAIRDAEYYRMQLSDERLKFSAALARAEEAERVAVWAVMHRARIELSVLQSGLDLVADFEYRVPCDGTKSGILAALAKAAGEE